MEELHEVSFTERDLKWIVQALESLGVGCLLDGEQKARLEAAHNRAKLNLREVKVRLEERKGV